MAMTLEEQASLMNDQTFRGRVKVAALLYAQYLTLHPGNSNSMSNWVFATLKSPDSAAAMLVPSVVINPNVQAAGALTSDDELKAAVQTAANAMM